MGLALGPADVQFIWRGDDVAAAVGQASDYGLAGMARTAIASIQGAAPIDTGSLQSSVHAAPPGYSEDETPIYDRRQPGVFVEREIPSLEDLLGQIASSAGKRALWVGSWIYYAYYVERGFYHVLAQRAIPGRRFIASMAELAVRDRSPFVDAFNLRWAEVASFLRRTTGTRGGRP